MPGAVALAARSRRPVQTPDQTFEIVAEVYDSPMFTFQGFDKMTATEKKTQRSLFRYVLSTMAERGAAP
jgi:hypothetical protein